MSNTKKIPFPSWMIGLLSISVFAVLAVGVLAWQWIAWERTIAHNEDQLRSASNAVFQAPAAQLAEAPPKTQAIDPATKSQWDDILWQAQHPYFKHQIELFFQEPDFMPDPEGSSTQDQPKVVWAMLPESLAKFSLANRAYLDSIHEAIPKSSDLIDMHIRDYRTIESLCDLIFLDAASCLDSHDQTRLDKALESVYEASKRKYSWAGSEVNAEIICLLHRGLDGNLISSTQASQWLERISQDSNRNSGKTYAVQDRASLFRGYDAPWGHWHSLPSLRMAMFDRYVTENTIRNQTYPTFLDRVKFNDSLRYYTLAVRVALNDMVAQNPGISELPSGFAEQLQVPPEYRNVMSNTKSHDPLAYSSDWITYERKSATEGQLNFVLPSGLTTGRYPIGGRYPIATKAP